MQRWIIGTCLSMVVCGWFATAAPVAAADTDRTAERILADLKAVEVPRFDPKMREDAKALREYLERRQEAEARRGELIRELFRVDPYHAQVPALMNERWQNQVMMSSGPRPSPELMAELDAAMKSQNERLRADAAYWKAVLAIRSPGSTPDAKGAAVEEFIRRAPKDERGASLLFALAGREDASRNQAALYRRIVAEYPDSRYAAMARGSLHRAEAVGKPFELEFHDAIKGTTVSVKDLRGKVVVIDFWATWCGPCVAEMPTMKKLYAKYHDRGVEFIGVSLDQPEDRGGLERLKEFVAKNQIPWPQYYQGQGWESKFSRSWGINAIPAVFVVDPAGNLYSTNARGKLDDIIPDLLEEAGGERPS